MLTLMMHGCCTDEVLLSRCWVMVCIAISMDVPWMLALLGTAILTLLGGQCWYGIAWMGLGLSAGGTNIHVTLLQCPNRVKPFDSWFSNVSTFRQIDISTMEAFHSRKLVFLIIYYPIEELPDFIGPQFEKSAVYIQYSSSLQECVFSHANKYIKSKKELSKFIYGKVVEFLCGKVPVFLF